jgi:predicted lipoprotein
LHEIQQVIARLEIDSNRNRSQDRVQVGKVARGQPIGDNFPVPPCRLPTYVDSLSYEEFGAAFNRFDGDMHEKYNCEQNSQDYWIKINLPTFK